MNIAETGTSYEYSMICTERYLIPNHMIYFLLYDKVIAQLIVISD